MRIDLEYLRSLARRHNYRRIVVIASFSGGWLHTRDHARRLGAHI